MHAHMHIVLMAIFQVNLLAGYYSLSPLILNFSIFTVWALSFDIFLNTVPATVLFTSICLCYHTLLIQSVLFLPSICPNCLSVPFLITSETKLKIHIFQ